MNAGDSLIFIADITGFTEFVNNTEIEHGQHIISELLENIVDSNKLEMEVSEIEGDAVLFYRHESTPSVEEIFKQAQESFIQFHTHLKQYENRRICHCGACSTASQLSLKFIIHKGKLGFTEVKNHKKPYGADLVLAHKLLKNNISAREYTLFAPAFKEEIEHFNNEETEVLSGSATYDNIGEVNYSYLDLNGLLKNIPLPPPLDFPEKVKKPVFKEIVIDRQIEDTFELVSNFKLKEQWAKTVDKIDFDRSKINRIGTQHICLFGSNGKAEFETVTNDFGVNKQVYGEKLLHIPLIKELISYFILESADQKTKLRMEVHLRPIPIIGWIFMPLIKWKTKKVLEESAKFLLDYIKENPADQENRLSTISTNS